jgi:hypothetical protein
MFEGRQAPAWRPLLYMSWVVELSTAFGRKLTDFGSIIAKSSHATKRQPWELSIGIHYCAHHIVQCALPSPGKSEQ